MDAAQAQIVMKTLNEIKARILYLSTKDQDQFHTKQQGHVENQKTLETLKIEGSQAQNVPCFQDMAETLIRELQETNDKQAKMISSLQTLFWELQAQASKVNPQFKTPVLSSQTPEPVVIEEDENDSDSELQETPILTPPTPVSRGAGSRIIILSHPSDEPSDFSTQAHNTLGRISKLLRPTGTLTRSNASELAIQETPILRSEAQDSQETLQARIASLENAIHSKTRQITEMEQDHEETIRLMSEQLDNAYSRLSPKSLDSTEVRAAQLESLEDRNIELNRLILRNIDESEKMQNAQKEYIKELENEVDVLRSKNMEVIRLETELTEREVRYAEMNERVAKYKQWLEGLVFENMIQENLHLKNKITDYEAAINFLKDELKDFIQRKMADQNQLDLKQQREVLPVSQESEEKLEKTDK